MQTQKLSKTVTSALAYIEDAIDRQAKGNEEKVMQLTWRAASDLEYGLFLFSLRYPEETRSSSWKLPPIKQPKTESLLASTQDLLKEATKNVEADNLKEAHKKMWIARGQLLRIHDFFEKKHRKT
jgi:non-homologous end joining protein Ku